MSEEIDNTFQIDEQASSDSQMDVLSGGQAYCFVTRQSNYKTIRADSRDEAQRKGNRNIIFGPVQFCHDGACVHEDEGYPNSDESCDA